MIVEEINDEILIILLTLIRNRTIELATCSRFAVCIGLSRKLLNMPGKLVVKSVAPFDDSFRMPLMLSRSMLAMSIKIKLAVDQISMICNPPQS